MVLWPTRLRVEEDTKIRKPNHRVNQRENLALQSRQATSELASDRDAFSTKTHTRSIGIGILCYDGKSSDQLAKSMERWHLGW